MNIQNKYQVTFVVLIALSYIGCIRTAASSAAAEGLTVTNYRDFVGKNAFIVLGLPTTATDAEIRKKFRKLALPLHPDRNIGNEVDATEAFKVLKNAFDKISEAGPRREAEKKFFSSGTTTGAGHEMPGFEFYTGRKETAEDISRWWAEVEAERAERKKAKQAAQRAKARKEDGEFITEIKKNIRDAQKTHASQSLETLSKELLMFTNESGEPLYVRITYGGNPVLETKLKDAFNKYKELTAGGRQAPAEFTQYIRDLAEQLKSTFPITVVLSREMSSSKTHGSFKQIPETNLLLRVRAWRALAVDDDEFDDEDIFGTPDAYRKTAIASIAINTIKGEERLIGLNFNKVGAKIQVAPVYEPITKP